MTEHKDVLITFLEAWKARRFDIMLRKFCMYYKVKHKGEAKRRLIRAFYDSLDKYRVYKPRQASLNLYIFKVLIRFKGEKKYRKYEVRVIRQRQYRDYVQPSSAGKWKVESFKEI